MADKGEYKKIFAEASALLKGKKNATGRAANGGVRGKLASAMYKGNAATRNNILKRFGAVNGAPAAAAVAAGVNVAAAAAAPDAGSAKITNANRDAAKAAMNAALKEAGRTRKASAPTASKYAKLLKSGDVKGAKKFLDAVLEKAAEKSGEKAAEAAVKAAKANVGMTNDEIKAILKRNTGKNSRPVNISKFKQALAEGKSEADAVAAVTKMRSNAAKSAAATKKAKKASNLEAAFNAAGKTGAAGAVLAAKNNKTAKKALVKAATAKANKYRYGVNNTRRALLGKTKFANYGSMGPGRAAVVYNVAGSPNSRRTRRNRRN